MMNKSECVKTKLSATAFGVGVGVSKAIFMLLLAWAGWIWVVAIPGINGISTIYYGYGPSFVGGLAGLLWGFIDGFIFGAIAASIYNLCLCCCCGKCKKQPEEVSK